MQTVDHPQNQGPAVWLERYTLEQAAQAIERHAGERFQGILNKLVGAVQSKALPVYERNRNARYFSPVVREWYEQAYWNDLNNWLEDNEPRIEWRFPVPDQVREDMGLRQELDRQFDEHIEFYSSFRETLYNGEAIKWRYWVEQMPELSAAAAARLMSCLDPDVYEDLASRPTNTDPSRLCKKAKALQRLAETQGKLSASPLGWLEWATFHGFEIHDGFRLAVRHLEAAPTPPASIGFPVESPATTAAAPSSRYSRKSPGDALKFQKRSELAETFKRVPSLNWERITKDNPENGLCEVERVDVGGSAGFRYDPEGVAEWLLQHEGCNRQRVATAILDLIGFERPEHDPKRAYWAAIRDAE